MCIEGRNMITANEFAERRNKVLDAMENNSLAILFSGVGKKRSNDENYPFEVNRNFYYLTGINRENAVLLLVKSQDEANEYLFIEEKKEAVEKWTGIRMSEDEARKISGIVNVLYKSAFEGKMMAAFDKNISHFGEINSVYLDLEKELKIDDCKSTIQYQQEIEGKGISVKDIHDIVMKLRMVKSEAEIELIRDAINTTDLGIRNVLNHLAAGRFEYNLRNIFEYTIKEDLNSGIAFDTIVAGGKNAVILHYPEAKDVLQHDELVLLDLGASKSYYAADISRTFPISGKFNDLQRKIYQIVLECNKVTSKFVRPGITLKEMNEFAKNFLAEECFVNGLIKSKEDIGQVYYHSVSHHLGLDTHDGSDRESMLVEGNVITCEPGLYFKEFGIGVRIEDDLLVTKDGCEVLSQSIIKEVDEIEKMLISK